MTNTIMPASLSLVLQHLSAVRELHRYLRKNGVEKDIRQYVKCALRPALEERIPILRESWTCDIAEDGVEWYPEAWKLEDELHVSLYVFLPSPVDPEDEDPSVNLYVPTEEGQSAFNDRSTACVKALTDLGFGLAVEQGWMEECPIGKLVSWLRSDGTFDEGDLVARIAQEAEKIVCLEAEITQVIRDSR